MRKTAKPELDGSFTPSDDIEALITDALGDGANYKIEVSRISGQSGTAGAFLDYITADELPDLKLRARDEWGPGTYLVRVKKDNKYHSQGRFSVEGKTKATPASSGQERASSPDPAFGLVQQLLAEFRDSQKAIIEAILKRDAPTSPENEFEKIRSIASLMKELRSESSTIGPQQMMEIWKSGVEAAKLQIELAGAGANRSAGGLFGLAESIFNSPFGAALGQAIAALANLKQPVAPAGPVAGTRPNQPALPQAIPPVVQKDETGLGQAISYLIGRAEANSSPELQAEWLYDIISDEGRAWICRNPEVLDELIAQFPAISSQRTWFAQLLEDFRKIDKDAAAENAGAAQNESGNSADAARAH